MFSEMNWPTKGKRNAKKEKGRIDRRKSRKRGREGEMKETGFYM